MAPHDAECARRPLARLRHRRLGGRPEPVRVRLVPRLTTFEARISTCSDKLRELGPAPQPFEQSRIYALEACKWLNQGIGKVNQVVADLRRGMAIDPIDPLGNATVLLATGQTELSTAVDALDAPSA